MQVDEQVGRFEDEIDPEFDDRFVTEFVVKQAVDSIARTGAAMLTFV